MRKLTLLGIFAAVCGMLSAGVAATASAAELSWSRLGGLVQGTPFDVHLPGSCNQCGHEGCIERVPVKECVKGKKLVYDCKVRYEYVSIPETRYRWVNRHITKEVPCPYCMPTCETSEKPHCYETEKWHSSGEAGCGGCGQVHCKTCQKQVETLECKQCGRKPGETIAKVRVKTCVKEPYIVYRQVRKPVCVKQPRYEHVKVSVTRYVCKHCGHQKPSCCEEECGEGEGCQ